MLDDFSRYIVAWKLCTTMSAADVTATLELALQASGLDPADLPQRPRLLSDNGPSYVASELAEWLEDQGMRHTRGKPYHPMIVECFETVFGVIERRLSAHLV